MPSIQPRSNDPGTTGARDTPVPDAEARGIPTDADVPSDEKNAWRHSSLDLEQGLDVVEVPIDSLPGDLLDDLLPAGRAPD